VEQAATEGDDVMKALANSIRRRRPPKLLKEVLALEPNDRPAHAGIVFKKDCKHHLKSLADRYGLQLGRFLVCKTRPLTLEERGALLTEEEARSLGPEDREELIKVFVAGKEEPVSVVSIPHSIVHLCSNHFFQAFRLYFVCNDGDDDLVERMRIEVQNW
jgi:hypothetical protein